MKPLSLENQAEISGGYVCRINPNDPLHYLFCNDCSLGSIALNLLNGTIINDPQGFLGQSCWSTD